jgi:hypothetical protein
MTEAKLATLTPREAAAMRALMDKRAVYVATGHRVAAGVMWIAISLVWQVLKKVDAGPETLPGEDPK